jgi:FkbM family methyltransferase
LKYYGQNGIDEHLLRVFFSGKTDGVFVEAGAFDGVFESTCKVFEDFGWRGVNIEPVEDVFRLLERQRPLATNLNLALSDANGAVPFTQVLRAVPIKPELGEHSGLGSLTLAESEKQRLLAEGFRFVTYKVECRRFDVLQLGLEHIDLFVLDVEGHELQALDGMSGLPAALWPRVFCIEHTFCGIDALSAMLASVSPGYVPESVVAQNVIFLRK